MTTENKQQLNYLFVKVFNQILSWEEQSFKEMGIRDITLRELHVIEAVYSLMQDNKNRMSDIAKYLSITPGSLTTSVNCLVKKGFLERQESPNDRRVVLIVPTEAAKKVNNLHNRFHQDMIENISALISDDDAASVLKVLGGIDSLFSGKDNSRK
jgi:DNA-binding MarR family transcriptional regulator